MKRTIITIISCVVIWGITYALWMSDSGLAGVSFGATSILIVIGVALDFSRRLQSQMIVRHYEGFLK